MNIGIIIVLVVRIGGYVLTYFAPLLGLSLAYVFDLFDALVFYLCKVPVGQYHLIDKPLDYLQYIMLIPIAYKTPVFNLFTIALVWRTFGMVLYEMTKNRLWFILFPNCVDYVLFIFFLLEFLHRLAPMTGILGAIQSLQWSDPRIWIGLVLFKLVQEISMHGLYTGDPYTAWKNIGGFFSGK